MKILVLNAGSSSQKCSLFEFSGAHAEPAPLWEGKLDWGVSARTARLRVKNAAGATFETKVAIQSHGGAVGALLPRIWSGAARAVESPCEIEIVGHRIVHGGEKFYEPTRITPAVIRALNALGELAPLHNRAEVEGIQAVQRLLENTPQVAVFDTGFHHDLPMPAAVYPGPYRWFEQGIRRYGFHGINHQYCAERAAQLLGKKRAKLLVTCHLGNGCSLAAIRNGRSINTTMGFTPLDGLMMGTRPGSLDPGILTYLLRKHRYSTAQLDDLLNHDCGLLGVSGISSDMRQILAARKRGHRRAALAFDIFIHRLREEIGAMTASLGGLDALVFTAGIGENSPEVRAEACRAFESMGLEVDRRRNLHVTGDSEIAARNSSVRVLVIQAQEDWAIARACRKL